jgi:CHAD domain-containing protein
MKKNNAPVRALKVSDRVHDLRVAGKKARAILRLISPESGPEARKIHERIRKMSHRLSATRDGVAVLAMIDRLAKGNEKLRKAGPRSIPVPAARELLAMNDELRKIGADIATLASAEATGPRMKEGLRRTFTQVKKLYGKCRKGGSPKRFHRWRRRAKDLLYQMETLAPRPNKREKIWIRCLKDLGDCLGEMHDLTLTLELLGQRRSKVGKLKKRARREYSKSARKAVRLGRQFLRHGEHSKITATFV